MEHETNYENWDDVRRRVGAPLFWVYYAIDQSHAFFEFTLPDLLERYAPPVMAAILLMCIGAILVRLFG